MYRAVHPLFRYCHLLFAVSHGHSLLRWYSCWLCLEKKNCIKSGKLKNTEKTKRLTQEGYRVETITSADERSAEIESASNPARDSTVPKLWRWRWCDLLNLNVWAPSKVPNCNSVIVRAKWQFGCETVPSRIAHNCAQCMALILSRLTWIGTQVLLAKVSATRATFEEDQETIVGYDMMLKQR